MSQFYFAMNSIWLAINMLFGLYAGLFMAFVILFGKMVQNEQKPRLLSANWAINLMSALFFVHCCRPYIGLRTHGVVQMFSGLQTEGGVSNHYIIHKAFYLFDYQKAVVEILYPNSRHFAYLMKNNLGTVGYKFSYYLLANSQVRLPLALRVNGKIYEIDSASTFQAALPAFYKRRNWFERFYLDFRHTDLVPPTQCRH